MTSELSFRDAEICSSLRVPTGCFYARLDGWNFHSLSRRLGLEKPFDLFLAQCMVETAKAFFIMFNPSLAYLFSDEISLLLSRSKAFARRLEKVDSVLAGLASSNLFRLLSRKYDDLLEISFDCRIIPIAEGKAIKYLVWRQMEAYRNCYNAYAQHVLIGKGVSPQAAADKRRNVKRSGLRKIIEEHGVATDQIPKWHERGIIIRWERFEKEGYNPVNNKKVTAIRRRIKVEWSPPRFDTAEGAEMVRGWISSSFLHRRMDEYKRLALSPLQGVPEDPSYDLSPEPKPE